MVKSYIYCITNNSNGKRYVGKSNDPERRWKEHKSEAKCGWEGPLCRAIRKYGASHFTMTVMAEYASEQEAFAHEDWWIDYLDSRSHQHGYNCRDGGLGGSLKSEESRKRLSLALKGKVKSEETKKKLSLALSGRFQSPEQIKASTEGLRKYLAPIKSELRNQILHLYNDKQMNAVEIADTLGYVKQHIYNILKELGIDYLNRADKPKSLAKAKKTRRENLVSRLGPDIIRLRNDGVSWTKIAKELKCDYRVAKRTYEEYLEKINIDD